MNRARTGFSLIELIIVIVVVAIAAVAIGSAFAYITRSQALSVDLQRATQIAQECADHVIGRGRKPGTYATVPVALGSTFCNPPAIPAITVGFARTLNIRDQATIPAGATLCDSTAVPAWGCKHVEIIVSRAGTTLVRLNFMLINY